MFIVKAIKMENDEEKSLEELKEEVKKLQEELGTRTRAKAIQNQTFLAEQEALRMQIHSFHHFQRRKPN